MTVIDRFEGENAVLEEVGIVPRSLLPADAEEGDVVEQQGDGNYRVNREATEQRRALVAERLKKLGL